jgi:hypothetical protein
MRTKNLTVALAIIAALAVLNVLIGPPWFGWVLFGVVVVALLYGAMKYSDA